MFRILKHFKLKEIIFLILALGFVVMQVWLEFKLPDYTQKLTEILSGPDKDMAQVWANGGWMLLCAAGSLASSVVTGFLSSQVAGGLSRTLRKKLFSKILDLSNTDLSEFRTSSLITRTTNDVVQIQMFFSMGIILLFRAPIMAIWGIVKISFVELTWTISVAVAIGIIIIGVIVLIFLVLPMFKKIQKLTDDLNRVTDENIEGIRVIRAFNAEEYQTNKFEEVNNEITKTNLFANRMLSAMNPLMTIIMNGLTIAIYFIGALLINKIILDNYTGPTAMQDFVTARVDVIAHMTAFSSYALQIVMSFIMLTFIFIILPRTSVSAKRINEVLEKKPSMVYGELNQGNEVGSIKFDDVDFTYRGEEHRVLKHISFEAKKGDTIALIGATGCGKSTIINLLNRYYDTKRGTIYLDGLNIKDYSEKGIRNIISIAPQKAKLFKGTIRDNITYGSKEIDEERLKKSLEIAQANFVFDLEKGLDSEVAQGGSNFSGGQKQRLSIARALYKNSEIIIFDDTFSALDYKTDMLVRKGIKENLKDKTIILVAQRIGTIKNADTILVVDKGRIVGSGKHEELLKTCEVYKEIALSQLSEEEL